MMRNFKIGSILIQVMFFSAIGLAMMVGLWRWGVMAFNAASVFTLRDTAFHLAEAGIDYYKWHMFVNQNDYQDGTGLPGPYIHSVADTDGNIIGQFELTITPPVAGSSLVTVMSTGRLSADPLIEKTISVKTSLPAVSDFAIIAEDNLKFEFGTEVFGKVHSNGGIRFDGIAHNTVSSALSTYHDPDHSGNVEFAVHTHIAPIDPYPPSVLPTREDIFFAGRVLGAAAVDFDGFTSDMEDIKAAAQFGGLYIPAATGNALGYHAVLNIDDTLTLYEVNSLVAKPSGCHSASGQFDWGTWSIATETLVTAYPFPLNGVVFVEDDLWIDGQVDGADITFAVGRFPENQGQGKHVIINNNLRYTNYDGSDRVGILSQENVNVGMSSADNLRIDAALLAKNGRVGRYYYEPPVGADNNCAPYDSPSSIVLYGSIASRDAYALSYPDGSGYQSVSIIYDGNLYREPPPFFPNSSDDDEEPFSWSDI